MQLNRSQWEDFCNMLNNPTQENIEARNKFFEECNKLIITRMDDGVLVEHDNLDEEIIIARLINRIE